MKKLVLLAILIVSYIVLYKIYIPRVNAFGCFDDCFTFSAGYFLGKGKILYSQIFYNHQLLPAYLSLLIQNFIHPQNLFELVLRHRQTLFFFGFLFNLLLLIRFGFPAFLFSIFFEFTKFYIFGDRFLAEGILVYPLSYLVFLSWEKLQKAKLKKYDLILAAIFSWAVVFLREAFIPIAVILFIYILSPFKFQKHKIIPISIFLVLCALTLLSVNPKDYFFELVTVNQGFFTKEPDILKSLFYPLEILLRDKLNLFNFVLAGIDILFLFSLLYLLFKRKWEALLLFVPLVLSNLRVVEPGRIFYDSFHMIPFYGIFLSATFILVNEIKKENKKLGITLLFLALLIFVFFTSSPRVFFREKIVEHEEFITNYGTILQSGLVFKNLSSPGDTLFVDGFDEVIYWAANLPSTYKYSMYTSLMPNFSIYRKERIEMFRKNPPNFYYGSCPKETNPERLMPQEAKNLYVRLDSFGKPSCIFVKKDKLKDISEFQWKKAKELGFELPLTLDR